MPFNSTGFSSVERFAALYAEDWAGEEGIVGLNRGLYQGDFEMFGWHSTEWSMTLGRVREPTLLEYFATTALQNVAQTVVREAIQNSLDAVRVVDGTRLRPAKVRIFVSGTSGALSARVAKRWFGDLFPHIQAQKRGPRNPPREGEPCAFLVLEDFNTRGLYGDFDRNFANENEDNAWVYFFHKEGDTSKQESDRGRWGVGKVVFPGASRIHSLLAFTVREDGKRLLMGQAMLRSRTVNEVKYLPDAWFAVAATDRRPPMPIEDQATIDEFRESFCVKRREETGLTVVVPYAEEERADSDDPGITFDAVADAVIADYFLPILSGALVVQVESPERSLEIDRGSILRLLGDGSFRLTQQRRHEISLAVLAVSGDAAPVMIGRHRVGGALRWDDSLIPDALREDLRQRFLAGEPLAIRVPVRIRSRGSNESDSHFDVYLQNTNEPMAGRPLFIREGLIIPDVRGGRARGVRSIVVAEDGGIATLLGDAENPAHTEWQPKSSNFKDKYVFGPSYIRFVVDSVEAIVRRIANGPEEEDPTVLLDVFSLPAEDLEGGKSRRRRSRSADGETKEPFQPPPPRPKRFRIDEVRGGFVVREGDVPLSVGSRLSVRAAYEVRRGDPFVRWHPADFKLSNVAMACVGATPVHVDGNCMVLQISASQFEIPFKGFDERRDLRIDVRVQEVPHEADD